jgi:hypothetical protein
MKFKVGTKEYEIKDDVLKASLEKGEAVTTLVEDAIVRTKAEDDTFVENQKKEARKEGVEIAIKKTKEELGLTYEGKKSIKELAEAAAAKAVEDAKLSPDAAVAAVTEKLKAKEDALKLATTRAENAEKTLKTTQRDYKIDNLLNQYLPKDLLLPVEDTKLLLRSKLGFEETEEGTISVRDLAKNEIIKKTETGDALPVKDAIEDFFKTNTQYIKVDKGGRGGEDSFTGDEKLSISKFNEKMKEQGFAINSTEYTTKLEALTKEGKIDIDAD